MVTLYKNTYRRLGFLCGSFFCFSFLLAMFLVSAPQLTDTLNDHLETVGEKVSDIFDTGNDHHAFQHFIVKAPLSKYRKRYKHIPDSGIRLECFRKERLKDYIIPLSVAIYQTPFFSSVLHTFLYRLACF
ncbi:hypothetical protein [Pedobacter sp. KLB.chiD]|uniref:hypothetical protein n=1 Tax=Pedobacter sp. KLB.chiD TaxID=3387402 RepID=UPI003999EDA8